MLAVMGSALGGSVLEGISSSLHAQHGVSVYVGLERDVIVRQASGQELRGRAIVVPADHEHSMTTTGPTIGFLYDIEVFHAIDGYAREGARAIDDRFGKRLVAAVHAHRSSLTSRAVLEGLGRESALAAVGRPRSLDRRVAHTIELLRDPSLDRSSLLARVGIGDAHLSALFARDVGLPIRTYRLWARLMKACALLRSVEATTAAHAAGFSDLAHLSRTCRRMLGHTPSEMRSAFHAAQ